MKMKIEVRFRGIQASDALREHVKRRAHFQLSRFSRGLSSVVVRIGDINGPKGGADKRCHVTVRGPSINPITIDELSEDAYSASDMALERAAQTVGRELVRLRASRRPDGAVRRAS
jgi:ribosome-associated translation inhibitor RaiA